jgi:peptidyl-prolyl cis-trans isomerase SurA
MKRALLVIASFILSTIAHAQVLDLPVAVIRLTETVNIGQRELGDQVRLFAQQYGRELTPAETHEVLSAMIGDELLMQGAARANVRVTREEITDYIAVQRQQWSRLLGVSLSDEQFRMQVERRLGTAWSEYVQDLTDELVTLRYVQRARAGVFAAIQPPTEVEIESYYEEHATTFTNPAMVSFRHIYIDMRGKTAGQETTDREIISRLAQELRSGRATFEEIVERSFTVPSFSAADFGYLLRNDAARTALLGQSFMEAVFRLEIGRPSGVLESDVALHIVTLTDKRPARIPSLDDPLLPGRTTTVRAQIRNILQTARQQDALAAALSSLVAQLRSEAEIIIYEQNFAW